MSYGKLTNEQITIVTPFIKNKKIHDLGAGDCTLAEKLIYLEAKEIICVDKEFPSELQRINNITYIQSTFANYLGTTSFYNDAIEIIFLSWPQNYNIPGLVNLLRLSPIIIYLGKNTEGSSCGFLEMWDHLSSRKVLKYVPDRKNSLIIYGDYLKESRMLEHEEIAFRNTDVVTPY